jgi:hypothetical protein
MQQWWLKIAAAAADMKSRTIHVGTRTAERGAEQEDEEGWKAISFHSIPAVMISDKKANCGPDLSSSFLFQLPIRSFIAVSMAFVMQLRRLG